MLICDFQPIMLPTLSFSTTTMEHNRVDSPNYFFFFLFRVFFVLLPGVLTLLNTANFLNFLLPDQSVLGSLLMFIVPNNIPIHSLNL